MTSTNGWDLLVLQTTYQCPLSCEHCIVDSNPQYKEHLETEVLESSIEQAFQLGIKTIGFTGGDPFLHPEKLEKAVNLVTSKRMQSIVTTSAFFSTSEEKAYKVLKPFRNLYMLGISFDIFHKPYTSLDHVRNAVIAAKQLGIPRIEIQVVYTDPIQISEINDQFTDLDGVLIRGQPLWPVGNASKFHNKKIEKNISNLELHCPMIGPLVAPDGKLHSCCCTLINLKNNNPLILGDLKVNTLQEIDYDAKKDPYYTHLKMFGFKAIVKTIQSSEHSTSIKKSYTDVCHLCHDIHKNKDLTEFLRAKLS